MSANSGTSRTRNRSTFPWRSASWIRNGRELPCTLVGETATGPTNRILEVTTAEKIFVFTGLSEEPIPALLRTFSAPVRLSYPYRHDDLVLLMAHEKDPFCRWEAGQQLAVQLILGLVADLQSGRDLQLDPGFVSAFRASLTSGEKDRAFLAEALTLPSEAYLAETDGSGRPDRHPPGSPVRPPGARRSS